MAEVEARVRTFEIPTEWPAAYVPFGVRAMFQERGIKYGKMRGLIVFDPLDANPLPDFTEFYDPETMSIVVRQKLRGPT